MSMVARQTHRIGQSSLSTLVAGPDDGAPIVLLHGLPASAELFREVLRPLGDAGRRAVAADLPGYGGTLVAPRTDHGLAGATELLAGWLRGAYPDGVWLVGHDIGGAVAQLLVTRHPDLVSRLTLTCTVVGDAWPVAPSRLLRAVARTGLYEPLARPPIAPSPVGWAQLRRGFADPSRLSPSDADRIFWDAKIRTAAGRRAFARHVRALDPAQTMAIEPDLASVHCPTQLVWAEADRFLPWDTVGQRLRDALPDPAVTVIADAGHYLPLERPRDLAESLLAWAG